ncbi:MAG: 30S ribosomal protein S16 [Clostridia bacterium]|nr:30S ribosomal protein S16 [Oscillospiraceae bacterium]MBQ9801826.1 30S ribosomal protein S16 [Clostridia bacterium]
MVKIRLTRTGKTHSPSYRIVVADQRSPRDGRFIEEIGHYNPKSKELAVNAESAKKWLGNGAQPTETVKVLLTKAGVIG